MAPTLAPSIYENMYIPPVYLTDEVRGTITRMVSSDGLLHLYLCDYRDRVLQVCVRDADIARDISPYIQNGLVSIQVKGYWEQTSQGWLPRQGECEVQSFIALRMNSSIAEALDLITSVAADGWNELDDPMAAWREIRGCD